MLVLEVCVSMDQYTILSWNVRGLNMRARRDAIRTLVGEIRPTIMCLQETKLASSRRIFCFPCLVFNIVNLHTFLHRRLEAAS